MTPEKDLLQRVVKTLEALSISVAALEKHAEPTGLKGTKQTDLKEAAQTQTDEQFGVMRDLLRQIP